MDVVTADAQDENSSHDIGRDIIPRLVREGVVKAWDFSEGHVPGLTEREIGYWRDIGTLDAYYDAHMDLVSTEPVFNLYNERWPILKRHERLLPPAKFVHQEQGRIGMALDSMVCSGVVVSGGVVRRSILSPGVRVHSRAEIDGSVLLHGVDVGHDSIIRNAIVDKGARIAPGARIGVDPDADRERFHVSAGGIVVIGKGADRRGLTAVARLRYCCFSPNVAQSDRVRGTLNSNRRRSDRAAGEGRAQRARAPK